MTAPDPTSSTAVPAEGGQLPLALRYPPDQRFDTFLGAPAGALGQLSALANGDQRGGIYLVGQAGAGKTHLALATCAQAESRSRRTAYLPLASAAGRLADALQSLHDNDLVALDGLDAVADDAADAVALFDFHNRARDAGTSILYTARVLPDALPIALPDLRSRLSQCARIALPLLDDDGRAALLRLRAQRRGLELDDAAIDWMLRHVDRDLASLTGLLDTLDRASLAAQRKVTLPFLRQTLGGERKDSRT